MNKKVLVAMSGGVDSSVAAYLLKQSGWDVAGAHLLLWTPNDSSPDSGKDAEEVCQRLGIPFHLVDLRDEFKERIVDYFCREYLRARTPNPCVRCNKQIKFGALMEIALKMGIDHLATGHYARVEEDERFPGRVLKKGRDPDKDQSYALFSLGRDQLARIVLPMGNLLKEKARFVAEEAGLHVSDKEESQDICFIPDGDYGRFIEGIHHDLPREGPVKNRQGEVLGTHKGLHQYTVGQRRGIGVAAKRPYYVLELRVEENTLVVGCEEETRSSQFEVNDVNWIVPAPKSNIETGVKIRYSTKEAPAQVIPQEGKKALIRFLEPQKAITPGQVAVFYDNDVVLGGGWIEGSPSSQENDGEKE